MEVVTLPPPTIAASAAATSAPLAESSAAVVPSILYPVGNPVLNNIDTLEVNFVTPWESVDMIVSCGTTAEEPDLFSFKTDNREQQDLKDDYTS
jgi:hypothetical protein